MYDAGQVPWYLKFSAGRFLQSCWGRGIKCRPLPQSPDLLGRWEENSNNGKRAHPKLFHQRVAVGDLGTTCVQEGGFEGPENGPKQRRINNRLLSYRPKSRNNLKILAGEGGPVQLQPLGLMREVKKTASTAQTRRLAGGCSLQVIP